MDTAEHLVFSIRDRDGVYRCIAKDDLIEGARQAIIHSFPSMQHCMSSPTQVFDYLQTLLAGLEHEVFAVLLLDAQHYLIHYEELFRGTIDGASVYPREVVKLVLQHNAAAVIFAHPHPSGLSEPSQADRRITERLQQALALIDVRVLDHIVVGKETVSFAQRGWL